MTAPLRKEMADLVEKRRGVAWGGTEWVEINNRWNELLVIWANSRIENMEADLAKVRLV